MPKGSMPKGTSFIGEISTRERRTKGEGEIRKANKRRKRTKGEGGRRRKLGEEGGRFGRQGHGIVPSPILIN